MDPCPHALFSLVTAFLKSMQKFSLSDASRQKRYWRRNRSDTKFTPAATRHCRGFASGFFIPWSNPPAEDCLMVDLTIQIFLFFPAKTFFRRRSNPNYRDPDYSATRFWSSSLFLAPVVFNLSLD